MKSKAMRFINESAKKTKFIYFLTIVVSVIQSATMVFFALSTKDLINSATDGSGLELVLKRALISIVLLVLAFLFSALGKIMMEKCRLTLEVNIKKDVFSRLLRKDYSKISAFQTGDIVSRITTDAEIVARGYTQITPAFCSMVTKIVLVTGALLFYTWQFTLALICAGVLFVICSFLIRKLFKKLHKKTRETESETLSYLTENTSNLLAVKVFSAQEKVSNKCGTILDKYLKTVKKQKYASSTLNSALGFAFSFMYIATVVWGAINLLNGTNGVTFGLITAMIQLVNQLQTPFLNFTAVFTVYYEMLSSSDRILQILDIKDEVLSIDETVNYDKLTSIKAENLAFSYGRETVLSDVNFEIKKGDFCLIKGISGIGKSTLFKLLLGVYDDYQGNLYFQTENDRVEVSPSSRNLFAFVPQGNLLFSGTIRENITFLTENATDEEIENACQIACVDFLSGLPLGIDTQIGENGKGLSEGQGQRVAIARAITGKKPIFLFDESTSALDETTEKNLLTNIKEKISGGVTVIIISHKNAVKDICNLELTFKDKNVEVVRR